MESLFPPGTANRSYCHLSFSWKKTLSVSESLHNHACLPTVSYKKPLPVSRSWCWQALTSSTIHHSNFFQVSDVASTNIPREIYHEMATSF
jgi:hypothetical protein